MVQNSSKILLQIRSRAIDWTKNAEWHPSLDEVDGCFLFLLGQIVDTFWARFEVLMIYVTKLI